MKCPKCDYLGFESGDRCRNCGYDFSLVVPVDVGAPDMDLRLPSETDAGKADLSSFPLFPGVDESDDAPLITVPSRPRPPLSVRRTPDLTRRRATPPAVRGGSSELVLDFATEEPAVAVSPVSRPEGLARSVAAEPPRGVVVAGLGWRSMAALTDHVILLGIDLIVVYSTLWVASLGTGDWRRLPVVPLLAFLCMLKVAYFSAFTAIGGQTIGKMAAGIRVVADSECTLDPARAVRRTLTGAVGLLPLGLGLVPALLDPDRRALHDRVSHTRVVELPSL
jgi:uncharacterized RDD family membrane protein YckC